MDRGIPSFNRIVIEIMQHKNMQTHYQKLYTIHRSKRVRTETSSSSIGKGNPKKQQQLEEKSTQIDKSNVILFQKMNRIMHRADPLNSGTNHLKINSRRFARHIHRVNEENQQFLERLCRLKPTIDNKKLLEQRKKQIAILKSLGRNSYQGKCQKVKSESFYLSKRSEPSQRDEFGVRQAKIRKNKDVEQSSSLSKFSASFMLPLNPRPRYTEGDYSAGDHDLKESEMYFKREMLKMEERRKKIQSSISQYQRKQAQIQSRNQQKSQSNLTKQSIFLNKSIILFATFKKMEAIIYKVQIHRKHRLYQIVCLQVDSLGRRLVISMDEVQGNKLLSSIDYDYQLLIDSLQVNNGNLSLNQRRLQASNHKVEEGVSVGLRMRLKNQSHKNPSHITEQSIEQEHSVLQPAESVLPNAQFLHTLYNK